MLRLIKRRFAIHSYVWKLSQELFRRYGKKSYYTIDEVTQAARRSGSPTAFLAYAHAIFCSRVDFDAYYRPLNVACTYDGLRTVVSRRYFGGTSDFDAARIISTTRREDIVGNFYESGEGTSADGH